MIKRRILNFLATRKESDTATGQPILGYDRYTGEARGKALLSYLPDPVRDELTGRPEFEFSNRGIARTLPRALNELGYIVDIISWDDKKFSGDKSYDLLIQHGGINYTQLAPLVKPGGKVVYFSSGSYWKYHNSQERARFRDFTERHSGAQLPYDRLIMNSEEKVNREADAIIALGNSEVRKTYRSFPRVYNLDLACYPDQHPDHIKKDFSVVKNNFLFFAGGGGIHKGLDLTIEAFLKLPQNLYIMAYIEPAVLEFYESALKAPNIHWVGPGRFRSTQFYEVLDRCGFAILPSCSEGQPGSMVECMNEGLIPVVSRDAHIDVEDFGHLLAPASIASISQVVKKLTHLEDPELRHRSQKARSSAMAKHSPELFLANLKTYFSEIMDTTTSRDARE